MLRLLTVLASLLLAALPALAGGDDDRRTLAELLDSIRATPGWSVTAETVSPETDTAALRRLVIERTGGFKLTAESVAAANVRPAADGGAGFGTLSLEDVTISYGATAATLPRIDLKGLALPSFAGWSPDPARIGVSTGALLSLLAQVAFAEASAPEVTINTRVLTGQQPADTTADAAPGALDQQLRLANVLARDMRDGALAGLTTGRIDSRSVDALGQPVTIKINGMKISGASVAALAAAVDPAAAQPARDWRTALAELTIEVLEQRGVAAAPDAPEPITFIARIGAKDIAVRRGDKSVGELYDEIVALAAGPEEPDSALFSAVFPAAMSWLRLGELTIGQAGISGGGEAGEFTFEKLTVRDLSPESLGNAALDGVGLRSGDSLMRVRRLAVERVRWPSADALAAVAAVEEQRAGGGVEEATLERAADNFLAVYPEIGRFALEGLSVTIPGVDPVTLEAITAGQMTQGAVTDGQSALVKLVIPLALTAVVPDATAALAQMGYRQLQFDGVGTVRHDRGSGAYDNAGQLTLAEGGTLSLSYSLAGLTEAAMRRIAVPFLRGGEDEAASREMAAALDAVTLTGATLRYEDALLVRRLVDWWAQQQGMPVAVVAQNLADAAAETVRAMDPSLAEQTRGAVRAFLLNPRSITVKLSPPQAPGLGRLLRLDTGAAEALPALGVTIEAGE